MKLISGHSLKKYDEIEKVAIKVLSLEGDFVHTNDIH